MLHGDRFTFGGGGRVFDAVESLVLWWESPAITVPLVCVSDSPHSGVEARSPRTSSASACTWLLDA
eukprot:2475119-Alexandrium_andersonii.AAC.1